LHDASDVAALNAPAQNVTVLQFVNEERRRQGFDVRFAREVAQGIPAGGGSVQHEKAAQLHARERSLVTRRTPCVPGGVE
jgi:hypothetical protein